MKVPYIPALLLITIFIFSCKKEESFTLNLKVNGDYKGYLYLSYENKKDSVLVDQSGNYQFQGKVKNTTSAAFYAPKVSSIDRQFYIENTDIGIEISITKKKINTTELNWIEIDTLIGTSISRIRNDFIQFKKSHRNEDDYALKLFQKANEIIRDNATNEYSGDLLRDIVDNDMVLTVSQKQLLFKNLDIKYQDGYTIKTIASKIFPKKLI